jgi:hypothetical protein
MTGDDAASIAMNTSSVLLREFAFLDGVGFVVSQASADSVTWRCGSRTFQVSRDRRDGYLDTHFGDDSAGGRFAFGLRQALAVSGLHDFWPQHGWQAWKAETVEKYAAELAHIVSTCLRDFLTNAEAAWAEAHRLTSAEAESYWNDTRWRQWRAQAESARGAGDWHGVLRAYEDLASAGLPLTEAEAARLRFARRQVESASG